MVNIPQLLMIFFTPQRIRAQAAVTKEECQVVEAEAKEGVGQLSDGGTMRLSAVGGFEISRFCGIYGVNIIYI